MTSESSSVLRMPCRRMMSRVFALLTPSLVSRSSQAVSIAEPRTPTVKLYSAVVQVVPCLFDTHLNYSRCLAYHCQRSQSSRLSVHGLHHARLPSTEHLSTTIASQSRSIPVNPIDVCESHPVASHFTWFSRARHV